MTKILSLLFLGCVVSASAGETVSLSSLLREMSDPQAVARYPEPAYRSLQASSYNRASTHRRQSDQTVTGWFADSDGVGFIRVEESRGQKEWVLMEHAGPGCITKIWTPFFYYDFNNRVGPNVRIYLDGANVPVIDESLIQLVRGEGAFKPPLAVPTARAGDSYLPIPFAKSCKVTLTDRAFYNIINYRAYPEGTPVETFSLDRFASAATEILRAGRLITERPALPEAGGVRRLRLPAGRKTSVRLPSGPLAVRQLAVRLPAALTTPALLRSTVWQMTCDGQPTIWCPVGDFFCSADALHPFHTWQRTVTEDGWMISRWPMPYRRSARIEWLNLGPEAVDLEVKLDTTPWRWDERSMHFHASWRPDDVAPGTPFQDWNFIDIHGQGVLVGDAWTVLNPQGSWWGEGDEKIYVDGAWDQGFPTHFGTGTEDYYGWAGGEVPTRRDEFSVPFLANVRVGGLDGYTTGFNICTRTRSLDAIPFRQRLVFDMESSFGTDIRNSWNLLGYSAVTFWYGRAGAADNRPSAPRAAAGGVASVERLKSQSDEIRRRATSGSRP